MKKTAFLLVLALLLQILLPPSMAGNVYAASTEEVAQTQAADGDQLKSLYDTYYLGACKKTGDYDHLWDGYEVKLYLKTSDDSLQGQEADAFKATIGGKEYAVGEVAQDYTLYGKDDYDYYEISVPILDDVSGTKEVSLTYPGKSGSKTVGGLSITLKKEDYFTTKGSKEVEVENTKNPIYTSSITGNAQVTAYWVSAFCGKEYQTIKKSYLVNADGKDSKQYGLNTKIMQIYQDTDSGRVQDDRYPAKKMPFDENGGSDVYNTQYTYGIMAGFQNGAIIEEAIPNGTYNMVLETESGCKTVIKNAVISTDKPIILGMMDSEASQGNASNESNLYGNDKEIHTDKHGNYVAAYVYGLNLNDEVAKYVKPYFAERSYDFTDGNVSYNDTIVGTYSKENGYEVANDGIFYVINTKSGEKRFLCSLDLSEYEAKYGTGSVVIANENLAKGLNISFQRPVLYARQLDAFSQTNCVYIADDIANAGDTVSVTVKADDNENRKELNCKVQEDASGVKKQKYFEVTRADIESLGSENGYFSITEISVNGKTYEAPGTKNLNGLFPVYVDMEYQPGNQTGSTSNGVFYVGNYTKDQDVVLEFHHKNEIRTVLEISIPKGTQKYLLTAEDMKSLTEGEEYSYCIRQAGDRHAVLLRSKQRVEEGFEAAGISMTGYPATPSTTVTLEYGDSTEKLFYCVMTEQNFQSKYDYQTELVPDNQWIAYAGAFTPFAGMTKSGTMMILTKVVNAAGTKAKYAYYDVEVRAGAGNDQDDDHKDDNGDKGNSNGTNGGNQGNNGNQNTNNGNQNTDGTLAVGTVKEVKGQKYKVLSASTVAFVGVINGKTKKVNIPKTVQINKKTYKVVQIAKNALKGSDVQTVVIGANVTAIQDQAFAGCKKLKKVTVGANVKSIGKAAFKDCKNLKNITVKSTKLKTVKAKALKGINKKATIKVPAKKLKNYQKLFRKKGQSSSVKIKK